MLYVFYEQYQNTRWTNTWTDGTMMLSNYPAIVKFIMMIGRELSSKYGPCDNFPCSMAEAKSWIDPKLLESKRDSKGYFIGPLYPNIDPRSIRRCILWTYQQWKPVQIVFPSPSGGLIQHAGYPILNWRES